MNRERFQALSKQFRGRLRERLGTLTGDPLSFVEGRQEQAAGRREELQAIAKQASDRQLEDFIRRNRNWLDLSGR